MAKFIKLFCVTGLGVLLLCLNSCDQKQEPVKPKKQVLVVSKSINSSKKMTKKKAVGNQKPKIAKSAVKKNNSMPLPAEPSSGSDEKKDSPPAMASNSVPSGSVTEAMAKDELAIAETVLNGQVPETKSYDRKGRIDPFLPLLSEKEEEPKPTPETDKPKRILTPLEKMDLSQIRLVAIIEMKGRFMAMVEEASGKGYEVKLGTYMGRDGGQVTAIGKEGIVIKEYFKDFKGIRRERLQEIKFHKTEGGE